MLNSLTLKQNSGVKEIRKKIDEVIPPWGSSRNPVDIVGDADFNRFHNVLDRVLQVHGALGMTDDTPIAFLYRHERAARIYDGADEVHKSRVAREILKSYSK